MNGQENAHLPSLVSISQQIAQFTFLPETPGSNYWSSVIEPVFEPASNSDPLQLMKNFNRSIITGQRQLLLANPLSTKQTFDTRFVRKTEQLKSELQGFHLLNVNLQGLGFYQPDRKGRPRFTVDKERFGLRISDIKVQKSALGQETEKSLAIQEVMGLSYSIGLKKSVS